MMNPIASQDSTPLDQVNRDPSKGNCYYITLEFIKDYPDLVEAGAFDKNVTARLVHGLLQKSGARIKHAWIEIGDNVYDMSNGQKINVPKNDYYDANDAVPVRSFTREDADALLTSYQQQNGVVGVGYWGDLTDDDIRMAMANYDRTSGVFASGVVFSDPGDAGNRDNLILNCDAAKTDDQKK
jgi:hypothetical protein